MKQIIIKGAKENNLKNIDLILPRNQIVCFVGVSGSGKSTIAFDLIAREGQRQYFESLPAFTRRYLEKANRPNVSEIKGISPPIVISQERVTGSPRSTVGTLTEAYTYFAFFTRGLVCRRLTHPAIHLTIPMAHVLHAKVWGM